MRRYTSCALSPSSPGGQLAGSGAPVFVTLRACELASARRRACGTLALLSRRLRVAAPTPAASAASAAAAQRCACAPRRPPPLAPLHGRAYHSAAASQLLLPPALLRRAAPRASSLRPFVCSAERDVVDVRDAAVVRRPLIASPMGKPKRDAGAGGSGAGAVPVHTSAHVQLLGLGLDDSGAASSVLLFFDKARYLFNAGEGFQVRPGVLEHCSSAHAAHTCDGLGLLSGGGTHVCVSALQ
jgi:hypothetical protein